MAKGQYVQPLSFDKAKRVVINHFMEKLAEVNTSGEDKLIAKLRKAKNAKTIVQLAEACGSDQQLLRIVIKETEK